MPRVRSRLTRRSVAATATGEGIVLTRARPESVLPWARRGLGPVVVAPSGDWTLIGPAGPPKARHPYDDAGRTLAGRPVSRRMRPALGFFRVGRQAVVTVHPRRRFAAIRWMIWTPRDGLVAPRGLPVAQARDVVAASGHASPAVVSLVEEITADVGASAQEVLAALLGVLGLPGLDVVTGSATAADLPGARLVVPPDRHARAFERLLREQTEDDEDDEDDADDQENKDEDENADNRSRYGHGYRHGRRTER